MNKVTGIITGLIIVLALGVGGFVLMKDDDTTNDTAKDATTTTESQTSQEPEEAMEETNKDEESTEVMAEEADQVVDMTMESFSFSQDTITAAPGETITVNLSVGSGSHNFTIDELDVLSDTITGSETDSVTFTIPPDAGGQTYAYYCNIGDHRAMGMEGQLVIL